MDPEQDTPVNNPETSDQAITETVNQPVADTQSMPNVVAPADPPVVSESAFNTFSQGEATQGIPNELIKAFKNAGNSTFAIGIFMLFAYPIVAYVNYLMNGDFNLTTFLMVYVSLIFFMAYFIYAGLSMKKDDLSDLKKSYRDALILMIVSLLSFLIFAPGGILVLFYLLMIINNIIAFSKISKYKKSLN